MFCSSCGMSLVNNANYCQQCGIRVTRINNETREPSGASTAINAGECNESVDDIITEYFYRGYPYDAIVGLLEKGGIYMHLRTLKRKLKELGLKRKETHQDEATVRRLIEQEMQGAGSLAG